MQKLMKESKFWVRGGSYFETQNIWIADINNYGESSDGTGTVGSLQ